MSDQILARGTKRLIPWANGLGLFVTREAKLFGWKRGTAVQVTAVREAGKEKIVVEKVK